MKLSFSNSGPNISSSDISRAEEVVGVHIPDALAAVLLKNNGGVPSLCYWLLDSGESLWVNRFLAINSSNGKGRTIEETCSLGREKGYLMEGLIPFAIDPGGNYFCFDCEGSIYFYTMDDWDEDISNEDNMEKAKTRIAISMQAFIEGLTDEEPDY